MHHMVPVTHTPMVPVTHTEFVFCVYGIGDAFAGRLTPLYGIYPF